MYLRSTSEACEAPAASGADEHRSPGYSLDALDAALAELLARREVNGELLVGGLVPHQVHKPRHQQLLRLVRRRLRIRILRRLKTAKPQEQRPVNCLHKSPEDCTC